MAEKLRFGQLQHGGHVIARARDGEIHLEIEAQEPAAPSAMH